MTNEISRMFELECVECGATAVFHDDDGTLVPDKIEHDLDCPLDMAIVDMVEFLGPVPDVISAIDTLMASRTVVRVLDGNGERVPVVGLSLRRREVTLAE
jgi:hypothetical protein